MIKNISKKIKKVLFNLKFIFAVHAVIAVAVSGFLAFNYLFGFGILENAHLSYLRYLMRNTVVIQNAAGAGGTGWVTSGTKSGDTVILTNGHVCGLAENGTVHVHYRDGDYILKVIAVYPKHDLCAIEAPQGATGGYNIASSFVNGESVYTLGHPLLEPNSITKGELSGTQTTQIIVGYDMVCEGEGYTRYNAAQVNPLLEVFGIRTVCVRSLSSQASTIIILPGNSGSCTVNIYGSVVAVAYAANESGTRSYHVPLQDLKDFLELL